MEIRPTLITPGIDHNRPKAQSPAVKPVSADSASAVPHQMPAKGVVIPADEDTQASAEAFTRNRTQSDDQPASSADAIAAYASHERDDKRDSLRQIMGVDLYA